MGQPLGSLDLGAAVKDWAEIRGLYNYYHI